MLNSFSTGLLRVYTMLTCSVTLQKVDKFAASPNLIWLKNHSFIHSLGRAYCGQVTRKMCGFRNPFPALVLELWVWECYDIRRWKNELTQDISWVFNDSLPLKSALEGRSHKSIHTQKNKPRWGLSAPLEMRPVSLCSASFLCSDMQVSCLACLISHFSPSVTPETCLILERQPLPKQEADAVSFHPCILSSSTSHVLLCPLFPCLSSGCSSFICG